MNPFAEFLLSNLPLWAAAFFLVAAPFKNRLRFSAAVTYAVALGAISAVCVALALIDTAFFSVWDSASPVLYTLPVLAVFFVLFFFLVRETPAKKTFVFFSGAAVVAFTIMAYNTCSLWGYMAFGVWLDRTPFGPVLLAALPFVLWPVFSGRMRWMIEQIDDPRSWRGMWAIPLVFLLLAGSVYSAEDAVVSDPLILILYSCSAALLIALFAVSYSAVFRGIQEANENARLKQNMQLLGVQAEQYASLRRHMEETAQARHDFRHQLLVIRSLADRKDWEELRRYLDQYVEGLSQDRPPLALNYAVDAVAGHYMERAGKSGVKLDYSLRLPEELGMPESEFCMVLANLLENALEACLRQKEGPRFIAVQAEEMNEYIVLIVENSFDESALRRQQDGTLLSSKRDDRGLGLASVGAIAEKYHGTLQITQKDGVFRAQAALRPPRQGN